MTITYTCPKCAGETSVSVSRFIPAKVSGPPENCYPAEGGEVDPCECEHCGAEIDEGWCREAAEEARRDAEEARAEERYEERRFRGGEWPL